MSRGGRRRPGAAAAFLTALLAPAAVPADGWSSSGSFSLEAAARIREGHDAAAEGGRGGWDVSARGSEWVSLDVFERSRPGKLPPAPASFRLSSGSAVDQLFALIAFAEAPRGGYDAIHHGARIRPEKAPTRMTLQEIYAWIHQTPGQPHAIGNFQIIPSTLLKLQRRLGLPDNTRFSRATQNRMAALLIADAGHWDFTAGRITRSAYIDNLAHIWAGLPLASGKSAYHGYAGNRATITRAFFNRQMGKIFGEAQTRAADASASRPAAPSAAGWTNPGQ